MFHRDPKVKLLKDVPLFKGCTNDELSQVAKLAAEMTYEAGETLLRAGSWGHEFLLLVEGRADVLVGGNVVSTVGPGQHFGEISLLEESRRTATVVAQGPVKVMAWDDNGFKRILADVPTVRAEVSKQAYERSANREPDQPGR